MSDKTMSRPCKHCGGTGRVPDDGAMGTRMRTRREKAGMSLRDLGRKLNLSAAYLSDLENGRRHWSPTNLARYEDALGRTPAAIAEQYLDKEARACREFETESEGAPQMRWRTRAEAYEKAAVNLRALPLPALPGAGAARDGAVREAPDEESIARVLFESYWTVGWKWVSADEFERRNWLRAARAVLAALAAPAEGETGGKR